jgi:hypothetical protein
MHAFAEDLLVLRKSGTQWSGQSLV